MDFYHLKAYYSNFMAFNSGIVRIEANITEMTPLVNETPAFCTISTILAWRVNPNM